MSPFFKNLLYFWSGTVGGADGRVGSIDIYCFLNKEPFSDQLSCGFWEWIPLGTLSDVSRATSPPCSMDPCDPLMLATSYMTWNYHLSLSFIYSSSSSLELLDQWRFFSKHIWFPVIPIMPFSRPHSQLTSAPEGCYLNLMAYWVTVTHSLPSLEQNWP